MASKSKVCVACGRGAPRQRNYFKVSNGVTGSDRFYFFDQESTKDGKAALKAARRDQSELAAGPNIGPWSLSVWAPVTFDDVDVIGTNKLELAEVRAWPTP